MDLKAILKDKDFLDMLANIQNMTIDVFEEVTTEKAFGVKFSKKRISYNKAINGRLLYADCYLAYTEAMKNLNALYAKHAAEYGTLYDFAVDLFEKLKNDVVMRNVLPSNNIQAPRVLSAEETAYYEAKKEEYIRLIITQVVPESVNLIAAAKVLDSAKPEDIADFVDETEKLVNEILDKEGLDKTNPVNRLNMLHEYLAVYLPNSYFQGDNLTTKKISINTTRFEGKDPKYRDTPDLLKGLAFLENHILAELAGLPARGIAFDGFRFFYTATGKAHPFTSFNLHQSMLDGADRYAQSNFVLNEDFAKGLLMLPKKFTKIKDQFYVKTTEVVDGDTIETYKTMYRKKFRTHNPNADFWFNINLEMGYFCKVKEYNRTQGTYSFSLFYMPDKEGEKAIQLFRIDKVADTFKGAPASHNLRGKEKIETTLHAHTYNLIDAVLKNYTKDESLGKMDLSHIFPTADGLDPKVVEEFFDCFCGIHGRHLKKVNQRKFAELFEKYAPINYSSME